MHPILARLDRLVLYLGAWLPGSALLTALVGVASGTPWLQVTALTLPLGLVYAFVCLAAFYPCQAMPVGSSGLVQLLTTHALAAGISSSVWIAAGIGWSKLLDRIPAFADTSEQFRGMQVLFFVVGILLYVLAVAVHYLLIAFETSRETESRNLELEVQAREAELQVVRAQSEQALAERELELAREIQRRLLPPAKLGGDGFRIAARNLPARFVAGDFFDVFELDGSRIGLVVADVAGKGVGASLISASVKAMTPLIAAHNTLTETLSQINTKLCSELAQREFVALSMALFDPQSGELQIANSGLPDPYLLRAGQEPEAIEVPGPRLPLGIRQDICYQSRTLTLARGERLLLLTDGLPEARTPNGEPLGYEALSELLGSENGSGEPSQWLDRLLERVQQTTDASNDDVTALLLERA